MTSERRAALETLIAAQAATRVVPPMLLPADPYFDLAGEEFGRRLLLVSANDGRDYCLRPEFTLPIVTDYIATGNGRPAAFSYLGTIFRHRADGPAEFDQAGLELLAQPDPDAALDAVLDFARDALALYGVARTRFRIGSVGLFEALLDQIDMPDPWRPRIRHRFGHPEALERLLVRLAEPPAPGADQRTAEALAADVLERLDRAGLTGAESRSPEEIVERYLEQRMLDEAHVPASTLSLIRAYLAIGGPATAALRDLDAFARTNALDLATPLATLARHLDRFGADAEIHFEASFSPRLDYYTGIVFEVTDTDGEVLVSGGQYDKLLERLGAQAPVAASGCAVWVDRLAAGKHA
jgi:ATP phosphoribosyltransferase regulatory subunit